MTIATELGQIGLVVGWPLSHVIGVSGCPWTHLPRALGQGQTQSSPGTGLGSLPSRHS